jgi:hypothetical protein
LLSGADHWKRISSETSSPTISLNGLTYSIGFDKVIVSEKKTSPLEVYRDFVWLFEKKRNLGEQNG